MTALCGEKRQAKTTSLEDVVTDWIPASRESSWRIVFSSRVSKLPAGEVITILGAELRI